MGEDSETTLTPEDTKDTTETKEGTTVTDWVNFIQSLFIYFVFTMLVGVVGSNFIFLTTRGADLDIILPTDDDFYSNKKYSVNKAGAYHMDGCNEISSDMTSVFESNFPYNYINPNAVTKEQLMKLSLIERLTNWFARTCAGTFKPCRALLKWWLNNFSPNNDNPLSNQTFQIYIAAPFTILMSWAALAPAGFSALGAATTADLKITVWGLFCFYLGMICFGLAFIIFGRLVGTLLFYGLSENWKEISNIMACNVKTLVILFGFFACGAAYDSLDPTVAGVMGIVYMLLVLWTVWKTFSAQLF